MCSDRPRLPQHSRRKREIAQTFAAREPVLIERRHGEHVGNINLFYKSPRGFYQTLEEGDALGLMTANGSFGSIAVLIPPTRKVWG